MIIHSDELHSQATTYWLEQHPPFTLYQAYGGVLAVPYTADKSVATLRIDESNFSGNSVVSSSSRKVLLELRVGSERLQFSVSSSRHLATQITSTP